MKKTVILVLALLMAISLAGCGKEEKDTSKGTEKESTTSASTEAKGEEDEEDYNTGDASLDKVRNEDGIGEKELLVVSFGTSFNDSRRLTIGAIEQALEDANKDYSVRRGFTADIVIQHVEKRLKLILKMVIQ